MDLKSLFNEDFLYLMEQEKVFTLNLKGLHHLLPNFFDVDQIVLTQGEDGNKVRVQSRNNGAVPLTTDANSAKLSISSKIAGKVATVINTNLDFPALQEVADHLSTLVKAEFGYTNSLRGYPAPNGQPAQHFLPHCDSYHNVLLMMYGTRVAFCAQNSENKVFLHTELTVGMGLFIPQGTVHEIKGSEEPTLHHGVFLKKGHPPHEPQETVDARRKLDLSKLSRGTIHHFQNR